MPFDNPSQLIALLDRLPPMGDAELVPWDPVLTSLFSVCVLQEPLGLG